MKTASLDTFEEASNHLFQLDFLRIALFFFTRDGMPQHKRGPWEESGRGHASLFFHTGYHPRAGRLDGCRVWRRIDSCGCVTPGARTSRLSVARQISSVAVGSYKIQKETSKQKKHRQRQRCASSSHIIRLEAPLRQPVLLRMGNVGRIFSLGRALVRSWGVHPSIIGASGHLGSRDTSAILRSCDRYSAQSQNPGSILVRLVYCTSCTARSSKRVQARMLLPASFLKPRGYSQFISGH